MPIVLTFVIFALTLLPCFILPLIFITVKALASFQTIEQGVFGLRGDARRKIIAGALALHHMEKNKNTEFDIIMRRLLHEYVVKDSERDLFGLSHLPAEEQKQRLERHAMERKKASAVADT
jgi:hypothetical protein